MTILKLYCKLSFQYLVANNIVGDIKAEQKAKSLFRIKVSFNSSISLLIIEKTQYMAFDRVERVIKKAIKPLLW